MQSSMSIVELVPKSNVDTVRSKVGLSLDLRKRTAYVLILISKTVNYTCLDYVFNCTAGIRRHIEHLVELKGRAQACSGRVEQDVASGVSFLSKRFGCMVVSASNDRGLLCGFHESGVGLCELGPEKEAGTRQL